MSCKANRRQFLHRAAAASAAAVLPAAASAAAAPTRNPNIIVILTDDHGFADVRWNGCKDIPMPHIDSIAANGVRFQCGYVSHPFCSPTRAGLLTGRYQQRFGHENNPAYLPNDPTAGLPLDEITLPQVLKPAGYVSGIVGKWHLGATPAHHPLRRGFDEQFGFIGGGHDYLKAGEPGETREYLIPIEKDGQPTPLTDYLTDALSREAAAFVRRHRNDPFFLYLAYNAPHTPQQVIDKYADRFRHIADPKRQNYAAMLSAVDDGVGLLLSTLRDVGLENDTLIFFLSDNGGPLTIASNGSRNDPLRAGKSSVYEGGIRVAFAAQWRGWIPAGSVFVHPISSLDILPTAAAVGGAPLPADRPIDGVNLLPYLTGERSGPPHERLFWRMGGGTAWAVREGRLKLVKPAESAAPELYDLDADIGEQTDLAAKRPADAARLRQAFDRWNAQLIPPRFQSPQANKKAKGKEGAAKKE